jgi:hypothetical protein
LIQISCNRYHCWVNQFSLLKTFCTSFCFQKVLSTVRILTISKRMIILFYLYKLVFCY